jgi:hypothetical protein
MSRTDTENLPLRSIIPWVTFLRLMQTEMTGGSEATWKTVFASWPFMRSPSLALTMYIP